MSDRTIELSDLRRLFRESAGVESDVDLDGDIIDTSFDDLGYDSLAIMEAAARITREYGVAIGDEELASATTPRRLLELVNRQ